MRPGWKDRSPRAPLDVVVIRADDVEPGIYAAVDISVGGICLMSQRKERVGGFVALSFKLGDHDLNMYAEVVWCRSDQNSGSSAGLHRLGLRWATTNPQSVKAIEGYVRSHDSSQLS